jgi:hypothetical protein
LMVEKIVIYCYFSVFLSFFVLHRHKYLTFPIADTAGTDDLSRRLHVKLYRMHKLLLHMVEAISDKKT